MELEEAIKKRRSIRKYSDKKLPVGIIGKILELAAYAPSAGNLQNWIFVVVRDKQRKNQLAEASLKQYWMNTAPALIIVCNDKEKIIKFYPRRGSLYSTQDCSYATQNIMLAAASLGLATCPVGAFDEIAVKRILKLPDSIIPEMILPIGYPGNEVQKPVYRNPLETNTFFEEYGEGRWQRETLFPLEKYPGQTQEKTDKFFTKQRSRIKEFFKRLFKKN